MEQVSTIEETLLELNQKLDRLTNQVDFLTEEANRQKRRQKERDELKNDLIPIGNDIFRMTIEQLEEIQHYVQIEDIMRFFKRLLRNTRNLEQILTQIESWNELWQDIRPLSKEIFLSLLNRLNEMEIKGYFRFIRGCLDIFDRVATSFREEDLQQLSNNIVLILNTVKKITQPEIMRMIQQALEVMQEKEPVKTSLLGLIRQLNDPAVSRGLSKTLMILQLAANN